MADGQVKREVLIELKLVASGSSKTIAAGVQNEIEKLAGSRVTAEESAASKIRASDSKLHSNRSRLAQKSLADSESASAASQALEEKAAKSSEQRLQRVYRQRASLLSRVSQLEQEAADRQVAAASDAENKIAGLLEKRAGAQAALGASIQTSLKATSKLVGAVAQLGLLAEDDVKKLAQGFVAVKGSVDLVSGGVDVIFGVRNALRASVTEATALKQAFELAAASGKTLQGVGGTAISAGGAAAGSAVASGGAAAAGGAAAGLGGTLLAAAKGAAALAGQFALIGAAGLALGEALGRATSGASFIGESIGWWKDSSAAKKGEQQTSKAEQARQSKLAMAAERDQKITTEAGFNSQVRQSREARATRMDAARGLDDGEQGVAARLRALQELDQAEAGIAAERERRMERQRNGEVKSVADQLSAVDRLVEAQDRLVTAEEKVSSALKSRMQLRQQELDKAEQAYQSATKNRESETTKAENQMARFARLDKGTQNQVRAVSEKLSAGGKLNEREAELLERTGLGSQKAQEFYVQKGKESGAENVLAGLGETSGLNSALAEEQKAFAELQAAHAKRAEAEKAAAEQSLKLAKSLEKLSETISQREAIQADQAGVQVDVSTTKIESSAGAIVSSVDRTFKEMQRQMNAIEERTAASKGVF